MTDLRRDRLTIKPKPESREEDPGVAPVLLHPGYAANDSRVDLWAPLIPDESARSGMPS